MSSKTLACRALPACSAPALERPDNRQRQGIVQQQVGSPSGVGEGFGDHGIAAHYDRAATVVEPVAVCRLDRRMIHCECRYADAAAVVTRASNRS